jgi:hypothetical protein
MRIICKDCRQDSEEHIFVSRLDSRCPTDTRPLTNDELEHIEWEVNDGYRKMKRAQMIRSAIVNIDKFLGFNG